MTRGRYSDEGRPCGKQYNYGHDARRAIGPRQVCILCQQVLPLYLLLWISCIGCRHWHALHSPHEVINTLRP
ncbi:hypothetical protein BDR03DRAFT_962245 [Suillus americanus]|nr:hypothetical protein BDR03DRAFT_962245 [Suillus americanus]